MRQEEQTITKDNISRRFDANYESLTKSEHAYLAKPQLEAALKQVLRYVERQLEDWSHGLEDVGRKDHRHNDRIEIIWDDGTSMMGLLEESIPKTENGKKVLYPKQISTVPRKTILGMYLRDLMGVKEGKAITIADFERYGRKTIDVSLQGEGIYYFDFSRGDLSETNTSYKAENEILKVAEQPN